MIGDLELGQVTVKFAADDLWSVPPRTLMTEDRFQEVECGNKVRSGRSGEVIGKAQKPALNVEEDSTREAT